MSISLLQKARESAQFIQDKIGGAYVRPKAVVICGSGLGTLADALENAVVISYADIPHFEVSTVPGHASNLVYGNLLGAPVLAMVGRFQ